MTRRTLAVSVTVAAFFLPYAGANAEPTRFRVKDGKATFVSDAPLETMTGVTKKVTGTVIFDPRDLSRTRGTFRVPVGSMRTGNDLRDDHLQSENWLDAKRHPHVVFEIVEVTGAKSIKPKRKTKVNVRGKFTAHGVTKLIDARATVRWAPAEGGGQDELRIRADFVATLEDHHVSVPSIVRLKMANEIAVSVDLRGQSFGAPTRASR